MQIGILLDTRKMLVISDYMRGRPSLFVCLALTVISVGRLKAYICGADIRNEKQMQMHGKTVLHSVDLDGREEAERQRRFASGKNIESEIDASVSGFRPALQFFSPA